jgi:hypothetical protein
MQNVQCRVLAIFHFALNILHFAFICWPVTCVATHFAHHGIARTDWRGIATAGLITRIIGQRF